MRPTAVQCYCFCCCCFCCCKAGEKIFALTLKIRIVVIVVVVVAAHNFVQRNRNTHTLRRGEGDTTRYTQAHIPKLNKHYIRNASWRYVRIQPQWSIFQIAQNFRISCARLLLCWLSPDWNECTVKVCHRSGKVWTEREWRGRAWVYVLVGLCVRYIMPNGKAFYSVFVYCTFILSTIEPLPLLPLLPTSSIFGKSLCVCVCVSIAK